MRASSNKAFRIKRRVYINLFNWDLFFLSHFFVVYQSSILNRERFLHKGIPENLEGKFSLLPDAPKFYLYNH